jgi:hypothetical protein
VKLRDQPGFELSTERREVSRKVDGLGWFWLLFALLAAGALVISRQPDVLFHPQFLAEDGTVWFADAWNRGWFFSLFGTYNGFYQTLPRLAAAFSLLVPLDHAPLLMNLTGLFVQILPVALLLSRRMEALGSLRLRIALAFAYVALPNSAEVNVTATNAQWHLALSSCLLVIANPPLGPLNKFLDAAVLVLTGLTGPFCVMLFPVAVAMCALRRAPWRMTQTAILAACTAVEAWAFLFVSVARPRVGLLGASPGWLMRILAGQVYLADTIGRNSFGFRLGTAGLMAIALTGTTIFVACLWKSRLELLLFAAFASLVFAASLQNPLTLPAGRATTAWQVLALTAGTRYSFFPDLLFLWIITAAAVTRLGCARYLAVAVLTISLFGVTRDWRYKSYPDAKFDQYVRAFSASRPEETLIIPENPPGWTIRLVKH